MIKKTIKILAWIVVGIPASVLLLACTVVFRITTRLGFGHAGLRFCTMCMNNIAVIRVQEILPYRYPVPETYATPGHIRFTAIFSANIHGVPLPEETQEPMMYMARINFIDRLVNTSPENIRQLERALIQRRLKTEAVFVFLPGTPAKVNNVIKFNQK